MKEHLKLAHNYWKSHVRPGDTVIDATCGTGQDTLFLAQLLQGKGQLIGYDIQKSALEKTQQRLLDLTAEERVIVTLKEASHETFFEEKVALIVYNLGYLPGGDKSLTTRTDSTLKSLQSALERASAISIMCYPGHEEGAREEEAILKFAAQLPSHQWNVCYHKWVNRKNYPSLLWLKRIEIENKRL